MSDNKLFATIVISVLSCILILSLVGMICAHKEVMAKIQKNISNEVVEKENK